MVRRGRRKAVDPSQAALGARAEPAQLRVLRAMIKEKDAVSYQGVYYTLGEARTLVERLNGFAEWAEDVYERRGA